MHSESGHEDNMHSNPTWIHSKFDQCVQIHGEFTMDLTLAEELPVLVPDPIWIRTVLGPWAPDYMWIIWLWSPWPLDSTWDHMVLRPWAQIPFNFTGFWGLGPDCAWIRMVLMPWAQIPFEFTWFQNWLVRLWRPSLPPTSDHWALPDSNLPLEN